MSMFVVHVVSVYLYFQSLVVDDDMRAKNRRPYLCFSSMVDVNSDTRSFYCFLVACELDIGSINGD